MGVGVGLCSQGWLWAPLEHSSTPLTKFERVVGLNRQGRTHEWEGSPGRAPCVLLAHGPREKLVQSAY